MQYMQLAAGMPMFDIPSKTLACVGYSRDYLGLAVANLISLAVGIQLVPLLGPFAPQAGGPCCLADCSMAK